MIFLTRRFEATPEAINQTCKLNWKSNLYHVNYKRTSVHDTCLCVSWETYRAAHSFARQKYFIPNLTGAPPSLEVPPRPSR